MKHLQRKNRYRNDDAKSDEPELDGCTLGTAAYHISVQETKLAHIWRTPFAEKPALQLIQAISSGRHHKRSDEHLCEKRKLLFLCEVGELLSVTDH